ncbi:MAG: ABC transporter ATP-binding protein [Thermoanaerobacterales bacterium]|nr:ABC transporter ATP-binding protein [Thermoanaerobacterales bacterium]
MTVMAEVPVLEVQDLHFRYPGAPEDALRGISLRIAPGEMVALIGQNGAGKSTLARHFNGLLRPTAGRVLVGGRDAAGLKVSALARHVGYVFQNPDHQIFHDTVGGEVAFGLHNLGVPRTEIRERVAAALEFVGLAGTEETYPFELSKGQRQRLALAAVLAMRTGVIVLDEPTTGQDYRESRQIMDRVKELNEAGHTIVFITHDMELVARYAARVVVLGQGRVPADGGVREVFARPEVLRLTDLRPPDITRLAQRLNRPEIPRDVLLVEEMACVLRSLAVGGDAA